MTQCRVRVVTVDLTRLQPTSLLDHTIAPRVLEEAYGLGGRRLLSREIAVKIISLGLGSADVE